MNFLKCGTQVTLSNGEIKAMIIGICIRGVEPNIRIEYHVSWYCGGDRHDAWLEDIEVTEYTETKKKAGMVNYEQDTSKLIEQQ